MSKYDTRMMYSALVDINKHTSTGNVLTPSFRLTSAFPLIRASTIPMYPLALAIIRAVDVLC